MGFLVLFSTGTYAGIGTKCVKSENIMKSTQKNFQFIRFAEGLYQNGCSIHMDFLRQQLRQNINIQGGILRRRKRRISRENEKNSAKTNYFIQIEIFSSPNPRNFPVFCVVTPPPGVILNTAIFL